MDLGLYNLKYPARRLISGALRFFRDTDPNVVSWAMLPVGAATAVACVIAARGLPWLWAAVIALGFARMFLGTLDGLIATHYGRTSRAGGLANRIAPELCDAMYLGALALARPEWQVPGIAALLASWLIAFAGLVGATEGLPTQSVGPVGQTDRLVALQAAALAALLADRLDWRFDAIRWFLWWVAAAGTLTVLLRLRRHLAAARRSP